MKVTRALTWTLIALAAGAAAAAAADDPLVKQDPRVLRFVERAIPWYPGSAFTVVSVMTTQSPSGSKR